MHLITSSEMASLLRSNQPQDHNHQCYACISIDGKAAEEACMGIYPYLNIQSQIFQGELKKMWATSSHRPPRNIKETHLLPSCCCPSRSELGPGREHSNSSRLPAPLQWRLVWRALFKLHQATVQKCAYVYRNKAPAAVKLECRSAQSQTHK